MGKIIYRYLNQLICHNIFLKFQNISPAYHWNHHHRFPPISVRPGPDEEGHNHAGDGAEDGHVHVDLTRPRLHCRVLSIMIVDVFAHCHRETKISITFNGYSFL